MDLARLKSLIDMFEASALGEFEVVEEGFRLHLVRKGHSSQSGQLVRPSESEVPEKEIRANTAGIIHLSPEPDAPPFVVTGQVVNMGQQVCIIEAMKVFMPVESDREGTIAEILVRDGQEVRPGMPLFRFS